MTPELSILLKATVALAIGLVATQFASRASASVRHLLLASTMAVLLALPIVSALVPALTLAVPMPVSITPPPSGRVTATPSSDAPGEAARAAAQADAGAITMPAPATVLRAAWALGALMLLGVLAHALWRVGRIRRSGIPWLAGQSAADGLGAGEYVRGVSVVRHEHVAAPVTCGWRHPMIVFPADAEHWRADDVKRALVHELEHVRRGDWGMQLVARAICAAYWCHPLVWVAWRRLCLECERACDDAVLDRMADTEYAEQLVMLAGRLAQSEPQPMLSMARRSDLAVRVRAVLDPSQLRGRAGGSAVVGALIAAAAFSLVVAPMRVHAVPAAPPEGQAQNRRGDAERQATRGTALDRALVEAAGDGVVEDVLELLDAGANVNATVRGDGTALLVAAREGDREMVDVLLRRGADINIGVSGDGNPLIMAAREGHADIVRTLLDGGADANIGVEGDGNPLIMAAREGHLDIVQLLIERGAIVDEVVPGDENAIISASAEGHLDVVRYLVARGANVNSRVWAEGGWPGLQGEWRTPLNQARRGRHLDVVRYLVSAGAQD